MTGRMLAPTANLICREIPLRGVLYQYSVQQVTNSSVGRASETVPELIAEGVKIAADNPY